MSVFALVTVAKAKPEKRRYDDDVVDRLSNTTTVAILVLFAVIITGQHYYGNAITCWVPTHFHGSWTKFTNNLCWVNDTYFVPIDDDFHIPKAHEIKEHQRIEYYQWMPFILLAQAFFFYVPCQFWQAFNSKSGIDSDNIIECAYRLNRSTDPDKRSNNLKLIRNQIHFFVSNPRFDKKESIFARMRRLCSVWSGGYLIILYIFVKLLYLANLFMQIAGLNYVLKTDYSLFGLSRLTDAQEALEEQRFLNNRIFPKVTMCDVHIRTLGNNQRYTVQCVLPVNLFTEKMYVFLWWWLIFVMIVTMINLVTWLVRTLLSADRSTYIRNHLVGMRKIARKRNQDDEDLVNRFTYEYLRQDGVFLFRIIGHNTNRLTLDDVIGAVWENWREKDQKHDDGGHFESLLPPKRDLFESDAKPLNGTKPPPPPKPGNIYRRATSVPSAPPLKHDTGSIHKMDL